MHKEQNIKSRMIQKDATISSALKQMDQIGKKLLLVYDRDRFHSLVSIGDLQRAIINSISLDTEIFNIIRSKIDVASTLESKEDVKKRMLHGRAELMPVLNENGELTDVIFWEDIFIEKKPPKGQISHPIIIMAGGKGTRLRPLTNIVPKALIPIKDKSIIEDIMDKFLEIGCNEFYLSLNYKAEMIKYYLSNLNNPNYIITYFIEKKPLGTAGSLYLLKNKIKSTFFVTNCDILINEDYSEILSYHKEYKNELTIISSLKSYAIPYGIIETEKNGELTKLLEKPEFHFQVNSGMYIFEPHLLNEIPENTFFHITQLIEKIMKRKGKIGVFPVSEKSWIDIGEWPIYIRSVNRKEDNENQFV